MRKVISHLFVSLDGVAQLDSIHGLIMSLLPSDEEEGGPFRETGEEDVMILGRKTYEQWAPFWPTSTLPYASHINSVKKFVASMTLDSFPWGNDRAYPLEGDLVEAIATLKRQPGENIGVHGSPSLVGAMLQQNLIDVLRLQIYPIIAGSGPRLFLDQGVPKQLALLDSKVSSKGVVTLTYQVNGKATEPA